MSVLSDGDEQFSHARDDSDFLVFSCAEIKGAVVEWHLLKRNWMVTGNIVGWR